MNIIHPDMAWVVAALAGAVAIGLAVPARAADAPLLPTATPKAAPAARAKAPPALVPAAKPVKPPVSQRASTGPGTQTEDDVYVGAKRKVQGVNTPGTTTLQVRPGANTSPNTGAAAGRKAARSGGDDDLDDLEVERRKVQGVNTPLTATPRATPGAGTSPNSGRSSSTAPGAPLPK